jgi:hypothetical protein
MIGIIQQQLTKITSLLVILCLLLSPIASGAMLLGSSGSTETLVSQASVDVENHCHHMAKDSASSTSISVQNNNCDHSSSCSLHCSIAIELSVIDSFTRQEKNICWSSVDHLNLKPSFLSRLDKPPQA